MRKITQKSVRNFLDGVPFKKDNTEVIREGTIYYLKLFGNKIAARTNNGELWIAVNRKNWLTRTTKERLNGLPGVTIVQKRHHWYLNGNLWLGEPVCIN
jgi:hypothetical protein